MCTASEVNQWRSNVNIGGREAESTEIGRRKVLKDAQKYLDCHGKETRTHKGRRRKYIW